MSKIIRSAKGLMELLDNPVIDPAEVNNARIAGKSYRIKNSANKIQKKTTKSCGSSSRRGALN